MRSDRRDGSLLNQASLLFKTVGGVAALAIAIAGSPAQAQNPTQTIDVDATLHRHPPCALIYGTAFATPSQLSDLNCPKSLRRQQYLALQLAAKRG